jgi:uncharacterized protein (TIGR00730 family)
MPVISVFGSSAPKPGSADYELSRQMGALLAEAGYTVQTGGYSGVMEAASKGASQARGRVIGVTCRQIEQFRPQSANEWVTEEIKFNTLQERLSYLVTQSDGAVVMPGGIGTLSELAMMWSLMQVGEISPRPLIAVGGLWARTLNAFVSTEYIAPKYISLIQVAKTPKDAIEMLRREQ